MIPTKLATAREAAFAPARIAAACGGKVLRRGLRSRVVTDSRDLRAGDCFVALDGDRFDGHDFLADAMAASAAGVVVCRPVSRAHLDSGMFFVRVEDSRAALLALAADFRRQHAATMIGITGSCGKTSTKDMLGRVLERAMPTVRSPKSYNNHIGVPLTLFQLAADTKVAVVELGTNAPGEIAELAGAVRPDIGIITRIDESHLMRLGSVAGVAREKADLIAALPAGGLAILNGDDPNSVMLSSCTQARVQQVRIDRDADWFATDISFHGLGTSFRLQGETPVTLPRLGSHNVYNALFTVAAAAEVGMSIDEIVAGLAEAPGSARRLECKAIGDVSVIDDTYNSNPASARAALLALAGLHAPGRRIVAFGEMLELGEQSEALHRAVGVDVTRSGVDGLVAVGEGARPIAEAAIEAGMAAAAVHVVPDATAAGAFLQGELRAGDWLLCKASRGVGLDRLVDKLEHLLGE